MNNKDKYDFNEKKINQWIKWTINGPIDQSFCGPFV